MKILVVDDDKKIVSMISDFLTIHNMTAVAAYTARDARRHSKDPDISLIVLDVNLEHASGFDVCKEIRTYSNVPIIFLTAKITQSDKILGLGIGADDYLTKPFDPLELIARIRSNVRRSLSYIEKDTSGEIIHKNIKIQTASHRVSIDNESIELSSTEYQLLIYLVENTARILTRRELLINVWNSEIYTENTVNTYIMRLRDKIEKDKNFPELLITIRGEGYLFRK
ncbi:MAG: response regulator transcription factor [Acidaminobacteraceae bacterium]